MQIQVQTLADWIYKKLPMDSHMYPHVFFADSAIDFVCPVYPFIVAGTFWHRKSLPAFFMNNEI